MEPVRLCFQKGACFFGDMAEWLSRTILMMLGDFSFSGNKFQNTKKNHYVNNGRADCSCLKGLTYIIKINSYNSVDHMAYALL
jgi:hypothetical protein